MSRTGQPHPAPDELTILKALDDPAIFAPAFRQKKSWTAWRAFLAALFGLEMDAEQRRIYTECTQRATPPTEHAKEAWLVIGRRGGKSFTLALIAVFLACFRDWRPYLNIGEQIVVRRGPLSDTPRRYCMPCRCCVGKLMPSGKTR
jgi:hypothetical protein